MELRHLHTFKTIVELGGFTKTAEHLGYAQSTITAHIQALEQEIGAPLFNRLGKKVILTEAGENLLPYASDIIDLYSKAKKITNKDNTYSGKIKIGSIESIGTYRLPSIIHQYKKRYPEVNLELRISCNLELKKQLRNGEIDLAFLIETENPEPDLYIEKLLDEPMALITPIDNLQKNISSELLNYSKDKTIFYTEKGCSYRKQFEEYLKKQGINSLNSLESWSVETIKQSVIGGVGIAYLPLMAVQSEIKDKKLAFEIIDNKTETVSTFLTYHKDKWLSPVIKTFIDITKTQAKYW